jgi:exopolyphosphatase/guanosine-5'-triphosphate,3'-diphosphate pyrophosphatase
MRICSVDIGTNSFILLIADLIDGKISPIHQEFSIPRLGEDIVTNKLIKLDAIERSVTVLEKFREIISSFAVEKVIPIATAVLRDAKNSEAVRTQLSSALGYEIKVITGEEEAYYSFLGVISNSSQNQDKFTTIDIGGGSTEIITGSGSGITNSISLPIGAAKIRDLFFEDNIYSDEKIQKAKEYINQFIESMNNSEIEIDKIVGVGGTITTLAFIKSGLDNYEPEIIDKLDLDLDSIKVIFEQLSKLTPEEIVNKYKIHPKRADILLPGQLILISIMTKLGIESIRVSSRGLRFGVIQDYLKKG